jgi:signal transduction histidine kinase
MNINLPINVLYVDDEEHNLYSFKANFRKDYNIYTTIDTAEALEMVDTKNISIVMADQRMPIMTGVEFLEIIRIKYPEKIRILITGHTDIGAAIDAINRGEVFRFIDKPWDADYVKNAIATGFEIFRTREDLKKKNLDLQKANEELDHFIYSASHDLRAPLMSILGIVNLSEVENEVEVLKQYFSLIQQSVLRLDSFVINIIDYYRNTRNKSEIKESIDFKKMTAEVLATMRYLPNFDKIIFNSYIIQEEVFHSDPIKIRIILNNLLSNAIKFQDPAKEDFIINIQIEVLNMGCTINIEDNGIGIATSQLKNIFKMFYRGGIMNSGSGVGLYIVEEAVHKLLGEIKVESVEKEGTKFIISIPGKN